MIPWVSFCFPGIQSTKPHHFVLLYDVPFESLQNRHFVKKNLRVNTDLKIVYKKQEDAEIPFVLRDV